MKHPNFLKSLESFFFFGVIVFLGFLEASFGCLAISRVCFAAASGFLGKVAFRIRNVARSFMKK